MRDRGILLGTTGPAGNVLKVRPPLVFRRAHADLLLGTLDEVLAGFHG
jgi:4-aminobutyrate aminotransferase-like enzyme